MKICAKCKMELPLTTFRTDIQNRDRRYSYCRPCERRLRRERYKRDPGKGRESTRRYRRTDKGRLTIQRDTRNAKPKRRSGHLPYVFSRFDMSLAVYFFGNSCALCGVSFHETKISWDHWIPLSDDNCPGTVPWNMVPMCWPCNYKKHDRILSDGRIEIFLFKMKGGLKN